MIEIRKEDSLSNATFLEKTRDEHGHGILRNWQTVGTFWGLCEP